MCLFLNIGNKKHLNILHYHKIIQIDNDHFKIKKNKYIIFHFYLKIKNNEVELKSLILILLNDFEISEYLLENN